MGVHTATALEIAGLAFEVRAIPVVLEAVRARFGAFVPQGARSARLVDGRPFVLEVEALDRFVPELEQVAEVAAFACGDAGLSFAGERGLAGSCDLGARHGAVRGAQGLGAFDALLRGALSLAVPASGGLLVHAALLPGADGARVLLGASGSGKSTAAAGLGAACDELVVLRPGAAGAIAEATPYWQGRPLSTSLRTLACLRRPGVGPFSPARLSGARALRTLLAHTVRYAAVADSERAILEAAAAVCAATPLYDLPCPEGDAFLPHLGAVLEACA